MRNITKTIKAGSKPVKVEVPKINNTKNICSDESTIVECALSTNATGVRANSNGSSKANTKVVRRRKARRIDRTHALVRARARAEGSGGLSLSTNGVVAYTTGSRFTDDAVLAVVRRVLKQARSTS